MVQNSFSRLSLIGLIFFVQPGSVQSESLILDEITVRGEQQQSNEENLTIREVRESPARDIGEALQNVSGLSSVRKGAIANDIVLRGFQRDNLNVFLDGVRLHGGCPSRMDPPSFHFDFAEVESITIIKGPYDLSNPGSLAGMIDAISKTPKSGPAANLNLSYGSFNYLDASATASYGGEKFDGLLGYAHKSSDVPESGDGKLLTDIYLPPPILAVLITAIDRTVSIPRLMKQIPSGLKVGLKLAQDAPNWGTATRMQIVFSTRLY